MSPARARTGAAARLSADCDAVGHWPCSPADQDPCPVGRTERCDARDDHGRVSLRRRTCDSLVCTCSCHSSGDAMRRENRTDDRLGEWPGKPGTSWPPPGPLDSWILGRCTSSPCISVPSCSSLRPPNPALNSAAYRAKTPSLVLIWTLC
ncbi:hypothetical protein VFPBJ_00903 [Purpureocillium lilacinum]|uniref:Uncharacterized protein n=1 Tax=Purpureocillium lilacinum TaxID=33203 RepID=A0A179HBH7_PURLI|nr:hypothetical protein VFPBJ_00903 [Purpureocillium lilacinum]